MKTDVTKPTMNDHPFQNSYIDLNLLNPL